MIKRIILSVIFIFGLQTVYADDNVFVYLLKYTKRGGEDVIVYCGITNNPEARALEHAEDETMSYNTFDTMVVFAGPMSRSQALEEETNCIYQYPIPKLYQTYPGDRVRPSEFSHAERMRRISKYESRVDTLRLTQTLSPRVEYTSEVRRSLVCEDCSSTVTDGVIRYSHENFDGHLFCRDCQRAHRSYSQARMVEEHEFHPRVSSYVRSVHIGRLPVCEECGASVTDGVSDFSYNHFGRHVFCMDCQSHYR